MKSVHINDYLKKCTKSPGSYVIPFPAAASILKIKPVTLERWVKDGYVEALTVTYKEGKKLRKYRGVTISSINNHLQQEREKKNKILNLLIKAAQQGKRDRLVTYSELLKEVNLSWKSPPNRSWLAKVLGEISLDSVSLCLDFNKDDFMLTALAVQKATGLPSDQFFDYACELNVVNEDDIYDDDWNLIKEEARGFWDEQLDRIFDAAKDTEFWRQLRKM